MGKLILVDDDRSSSTLLRMLLEMDGFRVTVCPDSQRARQAAAEARRRPPTLVATRWSIFAKNDDEAWQSLGAWRGLRAPGRLEAVDPQTLRLRADEMPRHEILAGYSIARDPADYIEIYKPLITDAKADVVTIQTTSMDQEGTIRLLGSEVLPELRSLAAGR